MMYLCCYYVVTLALLLKWIKSLSNGKMLLGRWHGSIHLLGVFPSMDKYAKIIDKKGI
jgi:hypothetical protein